MFDFSISEFLMNISLFQALSWGCLLLSAIFAGLDTSQANKTLETNLKNEYNQRSADLKKSYEEGNNSLKEGYEKSSEAIKSEYTKSTAEIRKDYAEKTSELEFKYKLASFTEQIYYGYESAQPPIREVEEWFKRFLDAGFPNSKPKRINLIEYDLWHSHPYYLPVPPVVWDTLGVTIYLVGGTGSVQNGVWHPNVSVWRGLTSVMLGKEIIYPSGWPFFETDEQPPNDMMHILFESNHYNNLTSKEQNECWKKMLTPPPPIWAH